MASIPRFIERLVSRIQPISPHVTGPMLGHVEVLDVERGRDARVLVLGLDAEEADAAAVDRACCLRRKCHQPNGSRRPFIFLSTWLTSGTVIATATGLAVLLGDHEPRRVEDQLQLLGVLVEVGLGVGHEAPVARPGGVVDLGEAIHVLAQRPARHLADAARRARARPWPRGRRGPAAASSRSEMSSSHIRGRPAFSRPGLLAALLVVGRVPRLLDHRLAVEALDEHAALVVHREVHRPDHAVAPARPQPALGGGEQRAAATSGSSSNSRKPNMPQRCRRGARCRPGRSGR